MTSKKEHVSLERALMDMSGHDEASERARAAQAAFNDLPVEEAWQQMQLSVERLRTAAVRHKEAVAAERKARAEATAAADALMEAREEHGAMSVRVAIRLGFDESLMSSFDGIGRADLFIEPSRGEESKRFQPGEVVQVVLPSVPSWWHRMFGWK